MATRKYRPETTVREQRVAHVAQDISRDASGAITGGQCHGTRVLEVRAERFNSDVPKHNDTEEQEGQAQNEASAVQVLIEPDCDAFITRDPGICLAIYTADCVPVAVYDPVLDVIGIAHAGWRGSLGRIAGNLIQAMTSRGSAPGDIHAWIAPGISRASYEVSEELIALWRAEFPGFADTVCHGRHLDLPETNRQVLISTGVQPEKIIMSPGCCTLANEERFFSYRRDASCGAHLITAIVLNLENS